MKNGANVGLSVCRQRLRRATSPMTKSYCALATTSEDQLDIRCATTETLIVIFTIHPLLNADYQPHPVLDKGLITIKL